jgi:hypothetical protein
MYLLDFDLAIELVRERTSAREEARLMALATLRDHEPSPPVRRRLALALATVSLASAARVRRLDACLADDLGRAVARGDGA